MNFADLGLSDELLRSIEAAGYDTPTPIQAQAIPPVLMMKDIIGIAQTGTGKTASFVLPMIDILAHGRRRALMPRSLILEPTRELAAQVAENFDKYGKNHDLKMALLIGGVQMGDQIKALGDGVDVLIATPGRLMDLYERGKILLTGCDLLVIDEADRMLDMGFIPDIETICTKLPANRQTLLFSATMPPPIKKLSDRFLTNPKYIEVARPASSNLQITQYKVMVPARRKSDVLRQLLRHEGVTNAIVFSNRKTTVRELNKSLQQHGFASGEIHGDIDQGSRIAELQRFKDGKINILVASDVAARGLDIKGVSHVFNYDTPWHPDDYVHRIGRTGRAGATGIAFTFVSEADAEAIANVEKLTGMEIPTYTLDGETAPIDASAAPRGDRRPPEKRKRGAKSDDGKAARPERSRSRKADVAAEPTFGAETSSEDASPGYDDRALVEDTVVEARSERPPRRDRTRRREAEPRRQPEPFPDTVPRTGAVPRAEPEPRHTRYQAEPMSAPGEWNGPVPSFLGVSAIVDSEPA